ncbi:MAG: oligosaccharide flippase family protein, partial [Acidimicrobiia bacterium]|nr:oligosaccharide flippase family protein [Acidimicrobiia bacterium]
MTLSDDARAAARGGTALLVLQTGARALGLLFVAYVTRRLVPAQFARYSIVASLVLMANFFADFGTTQVFVRRISRDPDESDRLLGGTLTASFAAGLVAYGLTLMFVTVANYSSAIVTDMAIGGLAIPAMSMLTSLLAALDGRGLIARRAAITMGQTSIVALGGVAAVYAGLGIRGAIAAIAVGPWAGLLAALVIARRAGAWRSAPGFDWALTMSVVRSAMPFAVIGASSAFVARFDTVLVSVVSSSKQTATYDLAQRLIEALTYVSAAITAPSLFIL